MNLVSVLGIFTMLGIAWAISIHRKDIQFRPILWGMGLQLLFATIIIRSDFWSFFGMVIFAGLLIVYLFKDSVERGEYGPVAGVLVASALVGYGTRFAPASAVWYLVVALIVSVAINAKWPILGKAKSMCAVAIFALTVGNLIGTQTSGQVIFGAFSNQVAYFLTLSDYGAQFLFGNLADGQYFFPNSNTWPGFGFLFAFKVLPTIIFFGGFMGVLYYLGIMQVVIESISKFMRWTIGTSGAETLSCSANIFVGQTEAPLLVKPFLSTMTNSELLTIMVGGFATIAGGVLAGYIAMGIPAGHLIAASVMSAPAALVISKIIFPEKEHSVTAGDVELPSIDVGENVLDAASKGISDGLKLAANVGAMLIGFIALIAVLDLILNTLDGWIDGSILGGEHYAYASTGYSPAKGEYAGYFPGSLQTLFGFLLRPLAWVMGVSWAESPFVGNLLGIKLSLNEFVAFGSLGNAAQTHAVSDRAIIISSYALCGFANFSSIGIQVGGLSALAPERRADLARIGLRAMLGGALASWTTASVAGLFLS
ncbi:MAG: NupC/NupG family nucleoside CNT transporter [Acidobacteria bacterium]|nr:NupC/NupG family nucleoside CNT transporter [Acidobacteriota bacterium]